MKTLHKSICKKSDVVIILNMGVRLEVELPRKKTHLWNEISRAFGLYVSFYQGLVQEPKLFYYYNNLSLFVFCLCYGHIDQ